MRVESYLPIFPGFAYTLWEPADYIITPDGGERSLTDEEHDAFDNEAYETTVATLAIQAIEGQLKRLNNGVSKVIFEKVWSPKYYNYDNDTIYVTYQLNKQKFSKYIKGLIQAHLAEWEKFLFDRFTSCDGFISYFSNDRKVWETNTCGYTVFKSQEIATLLEFSLMVGANYNQESLYYDTLSDVYIEDFINHDTEGRAHESN